MSLEHDAEFIREQREAAGVQSIRHSQRVAELIHQESRHEPQRCGTGLTQLVEGTVLSRLAMPSRLCRIHTSDKVDGSLPARPFHWRFTGSV